MEFKKQTKKDIENRLVITKVVGGGGQKVQISSYGDVMNSMVTIVNSTVLHI